MAGQQIRSNKEILNFQRKPISYIPIYKPGTQGKQLILNSPQKEFTVWGNEL